MEGTIEKVADYMFNNYIEIDGRKVKSFKNKKEAINSARFWYDTIDSLSKSLTEDDKYKVYVEFDKNPPPDRDDMTVAEFFNIERFYVHLYNIIKKYERDRRVV